MAESYITRKGGGGGVRKYSTWIVQADNGAKYTSYNGFDASTNPTPNLNNLPFNKWILNNSVSGEVVLNNLVLTSNGSFNNSTVSNQLLLNFVRQGSVAALNSGTFNGVTGVSPFSYYLPIYNSSRQYPALAAIPLNLVNQPSFYFYPNGVALRTGFGTFIKYVPEEAAIYFIADNAELWKGGLAGGTMTAAPALFGSPSIQIAYADSFLYSGEIRKIRAGNLANVAVLTGQISLGGTAYRIAANSNFVYLSRNRVGSVHANNLVSTGFLTANQPGDIFGLAADNQFVYYSGRYATLTKAWANNLVTVATASSGISDALSITLDNDYLYIPSYASGVTIRKYFKSNLTFVGATSDTGGGSQYTNIHITGNSMYGTTYGGSIYQYNTSGLTLSTINLFTITNAKE
jgi:hypothetical protein